MRLRCAPLTVALLLALPSPAVSRTLYSPAIEGGVSPRSVRITLCISGVTPDGCPRSPW